MYGRGTLSRGRGIDFEQCRVGPLRSFPPRAAHEFRYRFADLCQAIAFTFG
jgi:hypothetical protein